MTRSTRANARPAPPEGMSPEAVAKWHLTLPHLERLNFTDTGDLDLLAIYCDAFGSWCRAIQAIESNGATITTREGMFPSPWVQIRDMSAARMLDAGNRLGLNPGNRLPSRMPNFAEFVAERSRWKSDGDGYETTDGAGTTEVLRDE